MNNKNTTEIYSEEQLETEEQQNSRNANAKDHERLFLKHVQNSEKMNAGNQTTLTSIVLTENQCKSIPSFVKSYKFEIKRE